MISLSQESRIDLAPKTSWDRLPIAVIFQTKEATEDKSGSFLIVDGWTRLLSGRRMVFETTHDLNDEHMCVHMSHPESDHQFFQIQVTEKWPSGDGCWRYDSQFIRLLSETDLHAEASHC
jgi:hypothetical protein